MVKAFLKFSQCSVSGSWKRLRLEKKSCLDFSDVATMEIMGDSQITANTIRTTYSTARFIVWRMLSPPLWWR